MEKRQATGTCPGWLKGWSDLMLVDDHAEVSSPPVWDSQWEVPRQLLLTVSGQPYEWRHLCEGIKASGLCPWRGVQSRWPWFKQPRFKYQHFFTPLCLSLFLPNLGKQISSIPFLLVDNAFVNTWSANNKLFLYSLFQSKINDSSCFQYHFVFDICRQMHIILNWKHAHRLQESWWMFTFESEGLNLSSWILMSLFTKNTAKLMRNLTLEGYLLKNNFIPFEVLILTWRAACVFFVLFFCFPGNLLILGKKTNTATIKFSLYLFCLSVQLNFYIMFNIWSGISICVNDPQ